MGRVLTLREIRHWDPGHLTEAATRWTTTASTWETRFTELAHGLDDWDGAAAEHARERAIVDRRDVVGIADRLHAASTVARAGAQRIADVRRGILDAVNRAEGAGFTVSENFRVSATGPERGVQARALGRELSSRLDRLVSADRQIAAEITSAAAGLRISFLTAPPPQTVHRFTESPPEHPEPGNPVSLAEDPQQFNEQWNSLGRHERDQIFHRDNAIGNRPGMPFTDRDTYNRIHLDRLQAASQSEVDTLQTRFDELAARVYTGDHSGPTTDELRALTPRLAKARRRLDGYESVRRALTASDGVPRLLGLIDDQGHAAISIGDPDSARRTAVFVPGTGQDMTVIDGSSRRSLDMFGATLDADPSLSARDVSITTWAGYDRPMTLAEAAWPDRARSGGAALDSWMNGLHASHRGSAAVDTVIGHSYGSTLVGGAATDGHHLAADNVIAVGSPGMLSRHATDLALDSGATVYSMTAGNDPISLVTDLTLGADPNGADYGAVRLVTDSGAALPYSAGVLPGLSAHGSYWDEGNPGLGNIGAIIAGIGPIAVVR
ncbi:MAG: alpha/beta hydrolase [Mycobacterium sp.]